MCIVRATQRSAVVSKINDGLVLGCRDWGDVIGSICLNILVVYAVITGWVLLITTVRC